MVLLHDRKPDHHIAGDQAHPPIRINWSPEPRYQVDSTGSEAEWEEDGQG